MDWYEVGGGGGGALNSPPSAEKNMTWSNNNEKHLLCHTWDKGRQGKKGGETKGKNNCWAKNTVEQSTSGLSQTVGHITNFTIIIITL